MINKNIFSIKNQDNKKIIRFLRIKFTISKFKPQHIEPFQNDKPTIAMQVWHMDKGGLEEVVLQLASSNEIREKYNIVIIAAYSNDGYLADIAREKGIPVYSFFRKTRNIRKLIKKLNIKIVHFHYELMGIKEYKKENVTTIYTIHNNYIWMNNKNVKYRNNLYSYIDKFIAVSSQVKEYFLKKFNVDKNKVEVIPNGIEYIETRDIEPISKINLGFNKDNFVLLNVASFNLNKYHFVQLIALSKIINKYPNIKLIFIGNIHEQEYYNKIQQMINELKLQNNVKILDYVPKDMIYRYLKMSDCFIMTSITEGFGLSVAEAMMLSKPIIMTNIGGAKDFIINNDIGILIEHAYSDLQKLNIEQVRTDYQNNIFHLKNLDKTVNAIENMYLNRNEWKEKAKYGEEKIKKKFNVKRVQKDYLDCYNELIGGNY